MEKTGVSSLHGGWKSVAAQERTAPLPSPILVMICAPVRTVYYRYDSTLRGESLRLAHGNLMEDSSSLRRDSD